ncbi:MAG TPA: sugar phosphate nucleotidyltransferase [Verrucomicrobiae bacterium]|nr:sugar phosphate nucleotidyltransferase [Verrucomicrobiae bacterium]
MMPRLTLLVLAAGMGSRYGGLKQLEPVGPGGETLMDYSIYDALRAGFNRLVFIIRRDIETAFKESIGRRYEGRVAVDYVFQELGRVPAGFVLPAQRKKPWGTGHAVLMAADAVHEPFGVVNADDFYGAHSFQVLAQHLGSGTPDYALVGFVLRNTLSAFGSVARGVGQLTPDGYLRSIVELTKIERAGAAAQYTDDAGQAHALTGEEMVSMNMWGFLPSFFSGLEEEFAAFLRKRGQDEKAEFYIPTPVNNMVAGGRARVKVLRTPDSWFGITYRDDKEAVVKGIRELVSKGEYPERLWEFTSGEA